MSNEKLLRDQLLIARKNWRDWEDVYSHKGRASINPLFTEPGRFGRFCKEYSVHRTIRSGKQDEFRELLRDHIRIIVADNTGSMLDQYEAQLRPEFGAHEPPRRILSVISKVAAFVKPEQFFAWDRYARTGLNVVLGRSVSATFGSYCEYLHKIDSVWDAHIGDEIRRVVGRTRGLNDIEKLPSFQRRVLDVHLMALGGRAMPVPSEMR